MAHIPKQPRQSLSGASKSRWQGRLAPAAIALALAIVAVLTLSGLGQKPQKDGELVFTPESVDIGRVPLGQSAPYRYVMRNVGDRPVKITSKPKVAAIEGC